MKSELEVYGASLNNPLWWARRILVAYKADFHCEKCGKYLPMKNRDVPQGEAHHLYYEKGHEPWDYPLKAYQYLCHECHEEIHGRKFGWQLHCRNTSTVGTIIGSPGDFMMEMKRRSISSDIYQLYKQNK